MASIAIRVRGVVTDGSSVTIDYEFVVKGSQTIITGDVGVPFGGDPNGINVGIIGSAKAIAQQHGFPFNDGDSVMLIGGVTPVSFGGVQQVAHVVMKGSTVDSVFTDDAAAQARAGVLAVATDGAPQDDALKAAPWIATAPLNPE